MNIQSIRSETVAKMAGVKPKPEKPVTKSTDVVVDSFTTDQKEKLMGTLRKQPDVRPEIVAKANQLASDPNYPSDDVITEIARIFVQGGGR